MNLIEPVIVDFFLIFFFSSASLQRLRSYQDGYWLLTVHTYSECIVLSHWEIRLPAPWPDIPLCHIILTLSEPVLALSYWCRTTMLGNKYRVCKSLVWLNLEPNSYLLHARSTLYRFGHCARCVILEAYGVSVLACLPKLILHDYTSNIYIKKWPLNTKIKFKLIQAKV